MRAFLLTTAFVALLAACSPPAQQSDRPSTPPGPTTVACNDVTPDAAHQVAVGEEVITAAAAADLRGGTIAPGTYDLFTASRVGAATGWNGTRAVALDVSETQNGGVTFNWAGADPGGQTDRWTATFTGAAATAFVHVRTCWRDRCGFRGPGQRAATAPSRRRRRPVGAAIPAAQLDPIFMRL
ncbi:MAG: hypothetical protein IPL62_07280 [Caulobacteraceae bacterium]|nr:hypothetical protein [Caulobacteraceae bacterium]